MNERIRELLNEATSGLEPDLSPQRTVTLNEMEKFAELIVGECARVADQWVNDEDNGHNLVSAKLKQYFGVEE